MLMNVISTNAILHFDERHFVDDRHFDNLFQIDGEGVRVNTCRLGRPRRENNKDTRLGWGAGGGGW